LMNALNTDWTPPPPCLALGDDEVDIWCADLALATASHLPALTQTLSHDERERALRFHFEQDRAHFSASRGLLRCLLAGYLDLEPAQLTFTYGAYGKPLLSGAPLLSSLHFNLAHAADIAVFAFTRGRRLGIDLQRLRHVPDADQIPRNFCSPSDHHQRAVLPPNMKEMGFFNCGTRKEAYVKASGEGLSLPLEQFDVTLTPEESARLLAVT